MAETENLSIIIQAKDEASKVLEGIGGAIEENLNKIAAVAAATGAAIALFATNALNDFASTGEEISNMAERTGIATESISAMKLAADQTNVSLSTMESATKKMQLNLVAMAEGGVEAQESINKLGLDFDLISQMRPEEQLFEIGNAIAEIEDPATRTAAAIEIFGKSGSELLPLFAEGSMSMEEWSQKAKELGVSFDELSLEKAAKLDQAMDDMKATFEGFKTQIAVALAPAITELLNKIQPLLEAIVEWVSAHPELTLKIILATEAILALMAILPGLVILIKAVAAAFFFIAANPIVLVIAALAALGIAIYLAISDWDAFWAKIQEVWGAVVAYITEKVAVAIEWVKNLFNEWSTGTNALHTVLLALIAGPLFGFVGAVGNVVTSVVVLIQNWDTLKTKTQEVFSGIYTAVSETIGGINSLIDSLIGKITGAIQSIQNLASSAYSTLTGGSNKGGTKKKALGGSVNSGEAYTVGEGGPELFVPDVRGTIIPSSKAGGGGQVINITITGNSFLDRFGAREIGDQIFRTALFNTKTA